MAKFISMAATVLLLLLACLGTARAQGEKVLKVGPNSLFKIMLFADLHYGENAWDDWGPQHDAASDKCLTTLLDSENPDFVVYLGDVLTANNFAVANATKYWDKAIAPTRAKGIPWASVFGNHDDAPFVWPLEWFSGNGIPQVVCPTGLPGEDSCRFQGTHRLDLMKNEIEKNPLSYSKNGPPNLWPSVSNYVLQVSSSTAQNQPVAFLYFFDSGGGANPSIISSAQVSWFQKTSGEVNPDSRVPELIFWHIPSRAYAEVAPNGDNIAMPCVGSMNGDKVASQDGESGMMEVLTNRPSVKAVFVGHNHGNDWCCPYKTNLKLCYARHSGYGGYGTYPKGSRVIEITQQPFSIKSWIRMEDGTKHSDIVLA